MMLLRCRRRGVQQAPAHPHPRDLRALVQALTHKRRACGVHEEQLVFTGEDSPNGNLMLSVMGASEEFERSLIWEQRRGGIALAGYSYERAESEPRPLTMKSR